MFVSVCEAIVVGRTFRLHYVDVIRARGPAPPMRSAAWPGPNDDLGRTGVVPVNTLIVVPAKAHVDAILAAITRGS